jgi:hypothetical protein
MRIKDVNEKGIFKSFHQGIAKGFNATQKGGALAPDAYEKSVKKFFTGDQDDNKSKDDKSKDDKSKDDKSKKGGKDTNIKTQKPKVASGTQTSNAPLNIKKPIPRLAVFTDGRVKYEYDAKKAKWIGSNGKVLSAQDGVKAYNNTIKSKREYVIEDKTMDKAIKEGLADLAGRAEADHEVQMARADLYKIAKYAIKLHDMLKGVSEETGLEGWQQAKITKAADYISSVYHNLDYDMKFGEGMNEAKQGYCSDDCCGSDVKAEDCTCPPTCKHCDCNAVKEGKSPHKKGTKKYKKHMAAMHAGMKEDAYKADIAKRLAEKLGK